MRAFVTGGTGFIGSRLIDYLTDSGWQVTALVRPGSLSKIKKTELIKILEGDLLGAVPLLKKEVEGVDVVFHSAAIRDRWSVRMDDYRRTNIDGTLRLLDASKGRVGRFVYVSSVGVMGEHNCLDADETFSTTGFRGKVGYHSTKAAAERLVLEQAGEMEVCVIRPTITYGPGDRDGMLTRLIAMISKGRFIRVGRGHNHIHMTYIDDLLEGLYLAGSHPHAPGQIFIIAGPKTIQVNKLLKMVGSKIGRGTAPFFIPEPLARIAAVGIEGVYGLGKRLKLSMFLDPVVTRDKIDTLCNHQGFSYEKAKRMLGYSPSTGYSEGVEKTIQWMASVGILDLPEGKTPSLRSRTKTPG
jgi:dihydroflavonol-4-reductase